MKRNKSFYFSIILVLLLLFSGCTNQTDVANEDYIPPVLNSVDVESIQNTNRAEEENIKSTETDTQNEDTDSDEIFEAEKSESETATKPQNQGKTSTNVVSNYVFDVADVPQYSGNPYVEINGNVPLFSDDELTTKAFENYSNLDNLGRCGVAYANICLEIMPTEERGPIGSVRPSGWHTVKYNDLIDGNYLYNRCHLIGYQLAGENANEKNLITGTRYLNIQGMLSFENMVDDYVESTGNHVLYRVTPIFEGDNLVASGVLMEAKSVEDDGKGICFNVYAYNVQPGVVINYKTGDSEIDQKYSGNTTAQTSVEPATNNANITESTNGYVLNTNSNFPHQ